MTEKEIEEKGDEFLFVYEANGTFYAKLEIIGKKDGRSDVIHPVFYTGYTNNMNSEKVTWSEKHNKYVSESKDGSWLDLIRDYPDSVYEMDVNEVVHHDNKLFHCDGDLLIYLTGSEPKITSITMS